MKTFDLRKELEHFAPAERRRVQRIADASYRWGRTAGLWDAAECAIEFGELWSPAKLAGYILSLTERKEES